MGYSALAGRVGWPKAARAVDVISGAKPLPVLVPCHRLIGSNGSLTGSGYLT
jgi:methylated-DNA-[protein]-cysteine S-methyltransferase